MNMPILQPIPIETRGKGFWGRLFTWFFSTRKWRVAEDYVHSRPGGLNILIPKGFEFDGASIPRPLWMFLSPVGLCLIQGLIHDYGYYYDRMLIITDEDGIFSHAEGAGQKYWDQTFRVIGREVNGMVIINDLAYWALRIGGWMAWNAHRKREK